MGQLGDAASRKGKEAARSGGAHAPLLFILGGYTGCTQVVEGRDVNSGELCAPVLLMM